MSEYTETMNGGWRRAQLGEICQIIGGSTPSSSIPEFWEGKVIWITPTDLGCLRGTDIVSSAKRITEAGYKKCGTQMIPPGSVVMSSRAPIGHLGIARVPLCTNQGCKSFVPENDLDSDFLFFRLRHSMPEIRALGSGAIFTEVSKRQLERFEISFPSLPEQRRIAARLREELAEAAKARSALEAQLTAAEGLSAARLRAVFQSPEAQKWPRKRLGDVITLRQDIVHPRNNPSGAARFVGLEHVESNTGRRIRELPVQMENLTGRKARFFAGDIVYGYLRPYLNKVWIADFDGLCSVDQYVFAVRGQFANTKFVAAFMRSETYLSRAPIGETPGQLPRIRIDEVAAVEINLPSLDLQGRVVELLDAELSVSTNLQSALRAKLSEIETLTPALLRTAFQPGQ